MFPGFESRRLAWKSKGGFFDVVGAFSRRAEGKGSMQDEFFLSSW
jgi:hypothetical protein